MTSYTSPYTGNTSYSSDCGLFSSLCKEKVLEFEKADLESKYDFYGDRKTALYWSFAGDCPIASEYLRDMSDACVIRQDTEKHGRRGNYCPLKVRRRAERAANDFLKSKGYPV